MGDPSDLDVLRGVSLFADCDDDELQRISSLLSESTVPEGTVLIEEGVRGGEFVIIRDGYASVTKRRRTLGRLGPGSFLGEMALLTDEPRSATVKAVTPLRVNVLDAGEFSTLLADAPSVAAKIRRAAAVRRWQDRQIVV